MALTKEQALAELKKRGVSPEPKPNERDFYARSTLSREEAQRELERKLQILERERQSITAQEPPLGDRVPMQIDEFGERPAGHPAVPYIKEAGVGAWPIQSKGSYLGSVAKDPGRFISRTARNVAGGVGDALDLLKMPIEYATGVKGVKAGERLRRDIDKATKGYTAPRSEAEEIEGKVAEAVATMPIAGGVGAGLKVIPGLGKVGKFIGAGTKLSQPADVVGTMGAAFAPEYLGTDSIPGTLAASLAGGAAGSLGAGYLQRQIKKATYPQDLLIELEKAKRLQSKPTTKDTFEQAGIEPTLADVTDSKTARMFEALLADSVYGGSVREKRGLQFKKLREDLIGDEPRYFSSKEETKKAVKEATDKGIENYRADWKEFFDEPTNKVLKELNIKIPLKRAKQEYNKLREKHKDDPDVLEKWDNDELGKALNGIFKTDKKYTIIVGGEKIDKKHPLYNELVKKANLEDSTVLSKNSIDYYLNDIRKELNKEKYKVSTEEKGALKHIAGIIVDDIRDTYTPYILKKFGPEKVKVFQEGMNNYKEYVQGDKIRLNELDRITKDTIKDFTENFKNYIGAEGKTAELIFKGMEPGAIKNFKKEWHKYLGKSKDAPDQFSVFSWRKNYENLTPAQQKVLFGGEEGVKKSYAIVDALRTIEKTAKEANISKSGTQIGIQKLVETIATTGASAASITQGGDVKPLATAIIWGLLNKGADKILTNKFAVNQFDKILKAKNAAEIEKQLLNIAQSEENETLARAAREIARELQDVHKKDKLKINVFFPKANKEKKY